MDFKSQNLKLALKRLIKLKGLTYADLAERLECSLPTVKRILGPEELTLSRFLQLCEIADVNLAELETYAQEGNAQDESFTEEQERFLAQNRSHFAYLMKLFDGKTPRQIADEFNLPQRSTDRYLVALEKNQLIRVTGKQKVKPAFKRIPAFGRGVLARVYFEAFVSGAMHFFIECIKDTLRLSVSPNSQGPKSRFGLHVLSLTQASYAEWVKEQERALLNLQKISSFEEKTRPKEELMTTVVLDAHCLTLKDYPRLKTLENIIGDIPAI